MFVEMTAPSLRVSPSGEFSAAVTVTSPTIPGLHPTPARTCEGPTVRQEFHELGKVGFKRPADELAGPIQDVIDGLGLEREVPKLCQDPLLL